MVFKIDYVKKAEDSNFMVKKLLDIVKLKPGENEYRNAYTIEKAVFDKEKAKIEIRLYQTLKMKLDTGEGLQCTSIKQFDLGHKFIFNFVLEKDSEIEFEDKNELHKFLEHMRYRNNELGLDLPEEVEINLDYRNMPFGICHTLPKNILNNLSYFWIRSKDHQHIEWPYESACGSIYNRKDEKRLEANVNLFSEEGKKLQEMKRALVKTGFVKHQIEDTVEGSKDKFILEKEMDYEMFFKLEELIAKTISDGTGSNIEEELEFKGKVKRKALENIPKFFDEYVSDGSYVQFPNFIIKSGKYPDNTSVSLNPGDLETAARISPLFDKDNTKLLVDKRIYE